MFTYYTIIGKDINLLRGHVQNIKNHAGFNKIPCEKEFIVVVYTNPGISNSITQEIISYCSSEDIKTVLYHEPGNNFLNNLYACWNLGYSVAKPGFVFRAGSDQAFNRDGMLNMYLQAAELESRSEKAVLQANTIESPRAGMSRHMIRDFGLTFETFNIEEFERLCDSLRSRTDKTILNIDDSLAAYGKPTSFNSSLGHINRTDGCSWLMTREEWEKFGPMPPIERGITGDVIIHDRMTRAGYNNYIVRDCITYHFVRGESMSQY